MNGNHENLSLRKGGNESSVLRRNPYALEELIDGCRRLISFHYSNHIDLTPALELIWAQASIEGIPWPSADESAILLYQLGLLIPEYEMPFRSKGLDAPVSNPAGEPARALGHSSSAGDYVTFGVPSDRGNKTAGTRDGPRIIRKGFSKYYVALRDSIDLSRPFIDFSSGRVYDTKLLKMIDYGDIIDDPFESASPLFGKIEFLVHKIVAMGSIPVILGGDHSITASAILGLTNVMDPPVLLQFDAHHDCYMNSFSQRNGLNHGNFVQRLIDCKAISKVIQIGLRTAESVPVDFPHLNDLVCFISANEFSETTNEDVLKLLPPDPNYYISIDLDVLPPESGGSTATPVYGGIDLHKLDRFLDVFSRNRKVVGLDIVEARADSPENTTQMANAASRILLTFFLSKLVYRQISLLNQNKI